MHSQPTYKIRQLCTAAKPAGHLPDTVHVLQLAGVQQHKVVLRHCLQRLAVTVFVCTCSGTCQPCSMG